jgi:squalene-hopene/tetraprenyl-beta-curcumene cyclase
VAEAPRHQEGPPADAQLEPLRSLASRSLSKATAHLRSLQYPDGHWRGLLETNVTMDAEDMLLREFLGVREPERSARSARWIRGQQNDDGSWPKFYGGPGDISTTIEAYWALKLAGDDPGAEHMQRAASWTREQGGPRAARVFTHIWMALFGLWPWEEVPALPPELVFFPKWLPLNPYDFACWARQTIVALTIVRSYRPAHRLGFTLDELGPGAPPAPLDPPTFNGRILVMLDKIARTYERRPLRWLRRAALAAAERWVIARQEADGSWGGIQPPWVYSLIALSLRGYPIDHPVMRAGLAGLDEFTVQYSEVNWLEACQSPVWDTALAILALLDAGVDAADPDLVQAGDWLLDRQINDRAGDWPLRRPRLEPGGWSFEYHNRNYPDTDDTAVVALALRRLGHPDSDRAEAALQRAARWMIGMQSSDGGWGAFDVDNWRGLCRDVPFCDFGEVIDPPSADVTAHAVELLAAEPYAGARQSADRGLSWLLREQEADGSWFGRWGVNHVYGTWSVLCALVAGGLSGEDPSVRRGADWLKAHQNPDGGWGEDIRSYTDPAWIGRGASTASQTAWALIGLHEAGETRSDAVARGIRWLCETQRGDGTWDEPYFTGTGFPTDFYINYHLYRLVFPVMALGRCLRELDQ